MYKLNESKFYYDESDNVGIFIDFTTGKYFSLNRIGTEVFSKLSQGCSTKIIISALEKLPNCPTSIEKDINDFIDSLKSYEIIVDDDKKEEKCEFKNDDVDDGFKPIVDEFSEVQDLIMADPVHDVNEEKGWPVLKQ